MLSATTAAAKDTCRLHVRAQARGKARARAERANGEKANLDPRAVEKGSRSKDTKVATGARGKGRGAKGPVGNAAKLANSEILFVTPRVGVPTLLIRHAPTQSVGVPTMMCLGSSSEIFEFR